MAKEIKKGVTDVAPLFPLAEEVPKVDDPTKHKWKVLTPFYDVIQKRVVEVGEIVEHNQKRIYYNLIEQA